MSGDYFSPVLGTYDSIEVRPTDVHHYNENRDIEWINQYAFYFKWCAGNEQIWVYDTKKACLYQICNDVQPGILGRPQQKHGDKIEYDFEVESSSLGNFQGMTVYSATINHCNEVRPIIWINPLAFYFKWCDGNEQVWVYDAKNDGYFQLGCGGSSVHTAWTREKLRSRLH